MARKVSSNVTLRTTKGSPLSYQELDDNFDSVKQSLDDLNTLLNNATASGALSNIAYSGTYTDLTDKPTTIAGFGITDAFSGSYNDLTDLPSAVDAQVLADFEVRISALENPVVQALTASITAADTVTGGSSGTDDDAVIIVSNGIANVSTIRVVVKYTVGLITSTISDTIQTINLQSRYTYNLAIPRFRDYGGGKISKVIIEVYDDPSTPDARLTPLATKEITIVDPTPSISIASNSIQEDEGTVPTVTVNTLNMEDGRVFDYAITTSDADLTADILTVPATGTLTLANVNTGDGTGSINLDIPLAADSVTEGDETLTFTLTDQIDNTLTTSINIIINDSSRATETWTFQNWLEALYGPDGANVANYDVAGHITAAETLRAAILAEPLPSGATFTAASIWIQMLTSIFTDPAYQVVINTTDQTYVANLNGYVAAYSNAAATPGVDAFDYLVKRPSTGTNYDDIGYVWLSSNTGTVISAGVVIYTATEENPNDL